MKKRVLSFLLCFFLLFSLFLPSDTVFADDATSGMEISKTASDNGDGTYTIQMEAYATGEKVTTIIEEDKPTDIVLVLDQSGSMDYNMTNYTFNAYTGNSRRNSNYYNNRHNGGNNNLWHKLEDGSYVSVSVVREIPITYSTISSTRTNSNYYSNRTNVYHLKDGIYYQVTVSPSGSYNNRVYTYTSNGGLDVTSTGESSVPNFGGEGPLYSLEPENLNAAIYTYSYTNDQNETVTIGSSTGQSTTFTDVTLYQKTAGNIKRLAALKSALTTFVNQVNAKASGVDGILGTVDDINHRIAMVGFASGDTNSPSYQNTEILIGTAQYGYGSSAQGVYGSAFQNMDTPTGRSNVSSSIGILDSNGATRTDLGMEMANGILNANPVPSGEERNRVVVVFTDGVPTTTNAYNSTVANSAISYGNTAKNTYNTTVYTIGIFDGADATTSGNANGTEEQKANWFMQRLSSNNGTPQNPSYYLSASDADTLTSIFEQIANQIEQGGSATELNEEAIIRDIIAPAFTLPEGTTAADIVLETYQCTGKDLAGEYTWSKNTTALGATAVIGSSDPGAPITTNNQLSITGFDYSENWVGTDTVDGIVNYRGNKLVIKVIVEPREGFFGGNQVNTNTNAGLYVDASATEPLFIFDRPVVDVPLADIVIEIPDEGELGSYYRQTIPADALKFNSIVKIVGYELDFSKANYGLEAWQNEYVDIEVTTDATDTVLNDVQEDLTYTMSITVKPKYVGTINEAGATATGIGKILVFKPKLTFEDSDVYYGDTAVYGVENIVDITWVHPGIGLSGEIDHEDMTMLNAEPDLDLNYTPLADTIISGKVAVKHDIPVKVDVKIPVGDGTTKELINNQTTFVHEPCISSDCTWTDPSTPGDPAFLLHVKTGQLTITKAGGNEGEPYVFNIYKDGNKYTEATIVGNNSVTIFELPVGNYTIQEDTGWSWRFSPSYDGGVVLSSTSNSGKIICNNVPNGEIYWLNGYSDVLQNIADIIAG